MEPWEALDVDDSELSSFICPPKRQALDTDPTPLSLPPSNRTLTLNPSPSASIFRPCSQLYQRKDLTASQPTPNSQFLASDSHSQLDASPRLRQQPSSSTRRIPGPAGALQLAMQRKVRNMELLMQGDDGETPISTQEYIRMAVENGDEDDGDFALDPWVCAVDFIRRKGLVAGDSVAIGTPLCAIKNGSLTDRVAQVVAIIKSCNPNGLGDLMVTLKDPTGTIGASIHRKVLNYGNFQKEISVGAVLILQKIAVFSPARSARYLNITLNNVVKIISKDTVPLSKEICHPPTAKHTPVEDNNENAHLSDSALSHLRGRIDGIMSSVRQSVNAPATRHSQQADAVQAVDSYGNLCHREHSSSIEKEPSYTINDAQNKSGEAEIDMSMSDTNTRCVSVSGEGTKQENHGEGYSTGYYAKGDSGASNTEEISEDAEVRNMNSNEGHEKAVISGSSLPEWTDQQLEELLEYDL